MSQSDLRTSAAQTAVSLSAVYSNIALKKSAMYDYSNQFKNGHESLQKEGHKISAGHGDSPQTT
jgi:hypothetical protein